MRILWRPDRRKRRFLSRLRNRGGRTSSAAAAIPATAQAPTKTGGLSDTLAGALAYFTIIPAIVFLLIEPYNRRRFVRYHAFHSIFFSVACMVASFALRIIAHMPVLRWSTLLLWPLLWLAEQKARLAA